MAIDVLDHTFQKEVIDKSMIFPVIVDLWAPWCGPCKTLGPILEKLVAATKGQVILAKVDVDKCPQIAQAFQAQSIPAVYAMKDGKILDGFVGAQPEHVVNEFVNPYSSKRSNGLYGPKRTLCHRNADSGKCSSGVFKSGLFSSN